MSVGADSERSAEAGSGGRPHWRPHGSRSYFAASGRRQQRLLQKESPGGVLPASLMLPARSV